MWRPENWKNPYPKSLRVFEEYRGSDAFEAGADAMLEALCRDALQYLGVKDGKMSEWDELQQAYDKYREAKRELYKFYGGVNIRIEGDFCIYSCADCGADLLSYSKYNTYGVTPDFPIIHCGKIRLGAFK